MPEIAHLELNQKFRLLVFNLEKLLLSLKCHNNGHLSALKNTFNIHRSYLKSLPV